MNKEIKRWRAQVSQLRTQLEDLEDYLSVLETRRKSFGKKLRTQEQMEGRYGS